jgi:hypothetical protein
MGQEGRRMGSRGATNWAVVRLGEVPLGWKKFASNTKVSSEMGGGNVDS